MPAMNDNFELVVYDLRKDNAGWTVYDTVTLEPACVDGVAQVGLAKAAADDLMDVLNRLERRNALARSA